MELKNCRQAYGETLRDLGSTDPNIVVLEADLGKSTMSEMFRQAYSDRYFQVGIAEQNMTSVAAGLALTWKKTGGEVGREVATVAGVNNGEIYAVCADGTRVQGTFVIGSGTASGTGQASDTNGNVYKLLF